MTAERLSVAVIVGSTRQGRFGPTVARWLLEHLRQRADLNVDVIDLAETPLPPVQQAAPTIIGHYEAPEVVAYAGRIARADGVVIVTPEYNHGYPASLKLAIDSIHREWHAKPIAFVSYGGISGGLRSVEQLRQVFGELHAVTIRETVSFHNAGGLFDDTGRLKDPDGPNMAVKALLDQLTWWAYALRDARASRPYTI